MLETKINDYGKDKLKNLASFNNFEYYPIIYQWHDLHQVEPTRKFILYFAIPDDRGNVAFPYEVDHLVGVRIVACDVAQADEPVWPNGVQGTQDRLSRFQVCMEVRKDAQQHLPNPGS